MVIWRSAEGYSLTFRNGAIIMFWERFLLTFFGLSVNVLLTLCWVGSYESAGFWITVQNMSKGRAMNCCRGYRGVGLGAGTRMVPEHCPINFAVPSKSTLKSTASVYRLDAENPGILEISFGAFYAVTNRSKVPSLERSWRQASSDYAKSSCVAMQKCIKNWDWDKNDNTTMEFQSVRESSMLKINMVMLYPYSLMMEFHLVGVQFMRHVMHMIFFMIDIKSLLL